MIKVSAPQAALSGFLKAAYIGVYVPESSTFNLSHGKGSLQHDPEFKACVALEGKRSTGGHFPAKITRDTQ
jgi:hypothetical protein